ncbi:efflux RND transporter periplasmic adaptor subunit [Lysobacter sp. K5869]|uniref:efflux RND transporter periplasmic adaptor subunit n=1 Tax=Lysobacter sp. K5869 TaxID=2820808 RepID=UPI001C05F686|nr:efflux RND transporter periplasmic adaptor subunit [Lysobacter sp. K5869]QWP75979.1 efflux RND transporter periplasmic adaptor subunit [Lysobacter sp. K5869]
MPDSAVSVPSSRLRKRALAAAGLVVVAGAGLALGDWSDSRGAAPPAAPPPVPVVTAQVERRDVPHWQDTIGTVTALNRATLRTQVDGVLTDVLFHEGQTVQRGQLLARIDDRAIRAGLDGAQARRARDAAQLSAAQSDLTRFRQLSGGQLIARQMLDQQAASVQQLQATAQDNQASIDAARVQLSYTRILSPIDGRVGLRKVDPGNVVRASDADGLVTVEQVDPISVVFALSQDQLPNLRQATAGGAVAVQALDRDAGRLLAEGELKVIDNRIDEATGTVRLRAVFANAGDRLWPGQLVSVRVRTGRDAGALTVASEAVQRGVEGSFVYKVGADSKVAAVPVKVGYQDSALAVIAAEAGALKPGDTVVRDGQSRLKPGAAVASARPRATVLR